MRSSQASDFSSRVCASGVEAAPPAVGRWWCPWRPAPSAARSGGRPRPRRGGRPRRRSRCDRAAARRRGCGRGIRGTRPGPSSRRPAPGNLQRGAADGSDPPLRPGARSTRGPRGGRSPRERRARLGPGQRGVPRAAARTAARCRRRLPPRGPEGGLGTLGLPTALHASPTRNSTSPYVCRRRRRQCSTPRRGPASAPRLHSPSRSARTPRSPPPPPTRCLTPRRSRGSVRGGVGRRRFRRRSPAPNLTTC